MPYPTGVSLLWNVMRVLLRETDRAATKAEVSGWRQWQYQVDTVKKLFNAIREISCACREQAKETLPDLRQRNVAQRRMVRIARISHRC